MKIYFTKVHHQSHLLNNRGSVLIPLIATLIIFAALGAVMLPLTSTSTFSQIGANSSIRAYLMAESGYRYAASQFLNAGDEDARDTILTSLNGTYILADNEGEFQINIVSHWFKTTADPDGTAFLNTTVPGGLPSGMNLYRGYLQINGSVYQYQGVTENDPDVTFEKRTGNWPSIPVGSRASNVARSDNTLQTVTKNGDLVLRRNNRGANAFPLRNGQIQVNGNTYNYRELDLANEKLIGITDPDDENMPDFDVSSQTWIILEDFVKLEVTGTFAPGKAFETSRTVTYSTPIGWISRVAAASGKTEVTDGFADTDNWLASTSGSHAVATVDGSNALEVTGKDTIPATTYDTSMIKFDWSATDADLEASWENSSNFLNYDAQTKIKIPNEPYFMAGIAFRVDDSSNYYGISFLKAEPANDDGIPPDIVPVTDQLAVVLWEQTGGGTNRKWLAYKELSSADYILTENIYFSDDMESGKGNWKTTGAKKWDLTEEEAHSATHAWSDSPGGNYQKKTTNNLQDNNIDLSAVDSATLSFWHKLDVAWNKDDAFVHIRDNKWRKLATYDSDIAIWKKETLDISNYLPDTIRLRFRLKTHKNSAEADGWYVDDVVISYEDLEFPTLMVRVEEKIAGTGEPFEGQKVNDIRVYIGDVNAHGSAGTDPQDSDRKANLRDQVNWPPDSVNDTDATNDYFTLIEWDADIDSSVSRMGTGNELNAIIRSNSLTTPTSGSFTQSELALHTWGWSSDSVYFDDFAIQLENAYGGGTGFINPIQE